MKIISEFKDFIAKGNVMDLAVGVIIGGAFGGIVKSLVDDVMIFDNSEGKYDLIAKKTIDTDLDIFSQTKFNKLNNYYHGNT